MVTPATPESALREALQALEDAAGNASAAARALGIPRPTLQSRLQAAERAGITPRKPADELDIPQAPDPSEPIADLIARKAAQFQREEAARSFNKLIRIGVKQRGPVVIAAVGDPHVDSDRCDIGALIHDMQVIGRTPGMYALHLGDLTDNWVGRLGRLYAHSSTKASDGIRLAEHIFQLAPPLAVVAGNHDLWNEGMSWLTFCLRQGTVDAKVVQAHGARIELAFPGGQSLRIHARHDFPGHSQYNPNHGLAKEHLFGFRDHINIAGHKHIDAVSASPSPDGYVHWAFRVSGYKAFDDYAAQINAKEMKMAGTVALLLDVEARNKAEIVKPFWCLDAAADYLNWARKRAA